jgi:RNA polymerase sigma-B factor
VVQKLSERDQRILYLRFIEDQSQSEIGETLGVTQMQVSRLLERIFRTLRAELV